MHRSTLAIAFALLLCACGSGDQYDAESYYGEQREDRRTDAREDARGELDGLTYQDQHGSYACTDDCSGHDAGYQWAQDNEIEDAEDCGGNSASFIEGCEAYADDLTEQIEDSESDYEADNREEW